MIDKENLKYSMDLLEKEIDETNDSKLKHEWIQQANLYLCKVTDESIERKCQKYYQELIDDDYDVMWNKYLLGQSLLTCKDNNPKIIELFRSILSDKRSEINDLAAVTLHQLGHAYRDGLGTKVDYKEAYNCFRKGTETNNMAENWIEIGDFYLEGKYVEQDYKKAFEYYLKAYDKTIKDPLTIDNRRFPRALALYKLGMCFQEGYGVKKDLDKAIDYYLDCKDVSDISYFYDVDYSIDEALLEKRYHITHGDNISSKLR